MGQEKKKSVVLPGLRLVVGGRPVRSVVLPQTGPVPSPRLGRVILTRVLPGTVSTVECMVDTPPITTLLPFQTPNEFGKFTRGPVTCLLPSTLRELPQKSRLTFLLFSVTG